jgi:hypothetical protein
VVNVEKVVTAPTQDRTVVARDNVGGTVLEPNGPDNAALVSRNLQDKAI